MKRPEITGENRVTLDMAIDAEDRSLEGQFYSFNYSECYNCEGSGIIEKIISPKL